ncbi:MAG: DUF1439 domain-containing protein [Gammaproteobacteria bacterium]|nr:DUF1439 domain-containing protein [Gammaproteobacteria bacterium]
MKLIGKCLQLGLVFSILNWASLVYGFEQTLQFTQQELQQKLQTLTPIEKQTLLANIVLTDAKLELLEATNELAVTAFLDIDGLGGLHGNGSVTVQGGLRYEAKEGAFYLDHAKLTDLSIEQLSPSVISQIKPVVQDLLVQRLQAEPIYRLDKNDFRQSLLQASLKTIEVQQQSLWVTLGF